MDFVTTEQSDTLSSKITIKKLGIEIPWPGMNHDACRECNIQCPVEANSPQTYKYNFKVEKYYPALQTVAKIQLLNSKEELQACVKISVKLVK